MSKKKNRNQRTKKHKISQYDVIHVRMKRLFAMIIDWYIAQMIAVIPVTFYFRRGNSLKPEMFQLENYDFQIGLFLGIFGIGVGILYYIVIPICLWRGQTLGKKICKIRIADISGGNVTPLAIVKRELIGSTFLEGGIIIIAVYMRRLLPLFGLSILVDPWKYLAYALTLASIIYAFFQPLLQSFHDKLAHTIVIEK